jgi:site-specific DNA-methyltransferase (adenine-specific)
MRSDRIQWTNASRKLSELIPWDINPATIGKDEARRLEESLAEFGQVETIAISPNNEIYDGHQRQTVWGASKKFGMDYVVDVRVSSRELTEQERKKLVIYLRKGAVGHFDFDILANNWEIDELLEWGFDKKELDLDLWAGEPADDPGAQVDKAEELREKWGVEAGQLWQLGEHRLICGDCTDRATVERVMGGEKADCMWTDPPYGVDYVGKTKDALTIENDGADDLPGLLASSFLTAGSVLIEGAPFYVAHPPGALQVVFVNVISEIGWKIHEQLVWVKDSMVLGHSDYHYKHEPILYGWTPGDGRPGRGNHEGSHWYGDNSQVSVFEIPRPKRSTEHPTMKPPELVEAQLKNSTQNGDIVIDPFLGSGTTLIACERLGRKCRAVEISPAYCAVAIQRWCDMTGGTPKLIQNSEAV